jgi:hypothetical protein
METIRQPFSRVNDSPQYIVALLERSGFRIRGKRADCPHCQGHSRLTVAFTDEVFYCHRCGRAGNIRTLARALGLQVVPETSEQKLARAREGEFREWLDLLYWVFSDELIWLTMIAEAAKQTLAILPNDETAWEELRRFHDDEPYLMGALDFLAGETVSRWLEFPITKEKLRAAFVEARTRVEPA